MSLESRLSELSRGIDPTRHRHGGWMFFREGAESHLPLSHEPRGLSLEVLDVLFFLLVNEYPTLDDIQ